MSYDPIPLLELTVGHLETRRTEIADRLAQTPFPHWQPEGIELPDEAEPAESEPGESGE